MYEPLIKVIQGQMQMKMENDIFRTVQSYGIEVDKEELLRALKYDRQQYDAGYADGKADAVVHGRWIRKKLVMCEPCYLCSVCGKLHDQEYNFCNDCGADMREVDADGRE